LDVYFVRPPKGTRTADSAEGDQATAQRPRGQQQRSRAPKGRRYASRRWTSTTCRILV